MCEGALFCLVWFLLWEECNRIEWRVAARKRSCAEWSCCKRSCSKVHSFISFQYHVYLIFLSYVRLLYYFTFTPRLMEVKSINLNFMFFLLSLLLFVVVDYRKNIERGPVSVRGPVSMSGPVPRGPVENVILVLLSKSLVFFCCT